jgi:hypothetical protein
MNDEAEKGPAAPSSPNLRLWLTLVMIPFCWCIGFLMGRFYGSSPGEATMMATAWVLSALAGWSFYLVLWKPTPPAIARIWSHLILVSMVVVRRTRDPWPFTSRLAVGATCAVVIVLVGELLHRLMFDPGEKTGEPA